MSTDEVLEILKRRGFSLKLLADGTPAIRGPVSEATPALLRVLGLYRAEIVERMRAEGQTEAAAHV